MNLRKTYTAPRAELTLFAPAEPLASSGWKYDKDNPWSLGPYAWGDTNTASISQFYWWVPAAGEDELN